MSTTEDILRLSDWGPRAMHFTCPDCGPHVRADEDGCCSACGADCDPQDCGPDCPTLEERMQAVEVTYEVDDHCGPVFRCDTIDEARLYAFGCTIVRVTREVVE